jgi:hypothetical protein
MADRRGSVNKNFSQTMRLRCKDLDTLLELAKAWDVQQANSDIMGYMGMRVLADRADPDSYLVIADFGVIDPEVSAAEEALRNNERPETQASAERLRAAVEGDIEYRDYDEVYRTNP